MAFKSWRGTLGLVKPTMRPGSLEEEIRLLPEGVGIIPLQQNVTRGTRDEFDQALKAYEAAATLLAEQEVDMIHLAGTPPFMLLGRDGEKRLLRRWRRRFQIPVFAAPMADAAALRALGVTRLVGVTYSELQNELSRNYMVEAGFDVLAMEPMIVPFDQAGTLSSKQVYAHVRKTFLDHPGADGIYLQGNAWRVLDIIAMLEADFGVPVVQASCVLVWEVQKQLHIRAPRTGFGRLLAELP
jgi:maleate cis-trans isomerase